MTNWFEQFDERYEGLINAEIIEDSLNVSSGSRLTTFLLTIPRIILPEITRHRVYSFSIASSRAIPTASFLKSVKENPFIPKLWLQHNKGMQSFKLAFEKEAWWGNFWWNLAIKANLFFANQLLKSNISKQYSNRILEPFEYIKVLMTGTTWHNFFELRDDSAAQFEIQVVARKMKSSLLQSTPKQLSYGGWHIPFLTKEELETLMLHEKRMVSAARCARTSYLLPDKSMKSNLEADIKLYERLVSSSHWSPLEHIAQSVHSVLDENIPVSNFDNSWAQFRKLVEKYEAT